MGMRGLMLMVLMDGLIGNIGKVTFGWKERKGRLDCVSMMRKGVS